MFDEFDFENPAVRDGAALHRDVSPERWCVARADLRQLRLLVASRVRDGRIQPTERDSFHPGDDAIGPNIYTVAQQLIKPVTRRAGGMSWALMLHADGLQCDIFVTHAWQEGVYEFIDKVQHSWPVKAMRGAAYCCMLSNPQNGDIGAMISSPRGSPFARALCASRFMLVVPNQHSSIYSRIWCAYEAFLGLTQSKYIYTASAPLPGLVCKVGTMLAIVAVAFAASLTVAMFMDARKSDDYPKVTQLSIGLYHTTNVLLWFGPCCVLTISWMAGFKARVMLCIGSFLTAVAAGFYTSAVVRTRLAGGFMHKQLLDAAFAVSVAVAAACAEADRLWLTHAKRARAQLRSGYTGRLRDAESSVPEDKTRIISELVSSGLEQEVDHAIQVLLDSGISSSVIRAAVSRAGRLDRAGYWNLSLVVACVLLWMYLALLPLADKRDQQLYRFECAALGTGAACGGPRRGGHVLLDSSAMTTCHQLQLYCANFAGRPEAVDTPLWKVILPIPQVALWVLLFSAWRDDRRCFAAAALIRVLGLAAAAMAAYHLWKARRFNHEDPTFYVLNFGVAPVVLVLSIAGPGFVSMVPAVGPLLVRVLAHHRACRWPAARRTKSEPSAPRAIEAGDAESRKSAPSAPGATEAGGAEVSPHPLVRPTPLRSAIDP